MLSDRLGNVETDVLIVGAGAAGLRAAIAAHAAGARVIVLGKRARDDAHTALAAGGINAALATMDPADSWAIHAADTLVEGRWLGDSRAVEVLCREAPLAIQELIDYGAAFAQGADGRILQRFFGAHRYRRTCFAGDETGREIVRALLAEVDRRGIEVREGWYLVDLLREGHGVGGAVAFRLDGRGWGAYRASAVILATGGHTYVYRRSTARSRENTGDGMALAWRAGARLADMEMVQFHPTGMVWPPEVEGTLVTEAVRGEGGLLRNALGERYMHRYDPRRLELSARDRVALANYREIVEGRGTQHGGVWLDISHVPESTLRERLPRMVEQFHRYGVDISRSPMEVAPTAHYSMGGVKVDPHSQQSEVPGLWVVGEATAGLHGANRLGGNSLAECIVFGRRAGEAAAEHARGNPVSFRQRAGSRGQDEGLFTRVAASARVDPRQAQAYLDRLRELMWTKVGLVRDEAGLAEASREIGELRHRVVSLPAAGESHPATLALVLDLESMLTTAEITVQAARLRTESRGAHQRSDFPAEEAGWNRSIVARQVADELRFDLETLPSASSVVLAALPDEGELDITGGLLE